MENRKLWMVGAALVGATLTISTQARAAPDQGNAITIFAKATAICERDNGHLWGTSLCGPILLVDYRDQAIVANQVDALNNLKANGKVFVGKLPDTVIVANTPTEWAGVRWTQLDVPLTDDPNTLAVLLGHELFHRIQPELGLTRPEMANHHLDILEGRYLLQLEWRALTKSLVAGNTRASRRALTDALAFRTERYRLFPNASIQEAALEVAEGVPEYTGVMVGLETRQARIAYAIGDLSKFVNAPTFVRSFAYATGPAYGLMLDRLDPQWKSKLSAQKGPSELLADAVGRTRVETETLDVRTKRYDDGILRSQEVRRENNRQQRLAALNALLVDGPVLTLPLHKANFQFNPQTLVALDGVGTVYPTMRITDDWGSLEVSSGGALVYDAGAKATISTKSFDASALTGSGWKLALSPGWEIAKGTRAGDFVIKERRSSGH